MPSEVYVSQIQDKNRWMNSAPKLYHNYLMFKDKYFQSEPGHSIAFHTISTNHNKICNISTVQFISRIRYLLVRPQLKHKICHLCPLIIYTQIRFQNTTNKQVDPETCCLIEIHFWPKPTF